MSKIRKYSMTWREVYERVSRLPGGKCYGIPRGGAVVAAMTGRAAENHEAADFIVEDIIDSGKTAARYEERTGLKVYALVDKRIEHQGEWVHFPWEEQPAIDIRDTVVRQLEYIGEDPKREGLKETPARVVQSWEHLYRGYDEDPAEVLKFFTSENYSENSEMIVLRDVEFYSTCEHHMLPFFGKAHVGYIPNQRLVGISKLARVLEAYSRRLQIQERVGQQVVMTLMDVLKPRGAGCVLEAVHFCMTSRGVEKQKSSMVTSCLRGAFSEDKVRAEFLKLIGR